MAIDSQAVRKFWEMRAQQHTRNAALTNLEEDKDLARMKVRLEEEKVFNYLQFPARIGSLLDLGAGNGFWAKKFAGYVSRITAVEYCRELVEQGRGLTENIPNITFVHCDAQHFTSADPFDIIFISGLLIYLNDDELAMLSKNIDLYSREGTVLVLRDGTGRQDRFEIRNRFSDVLKTNYSAIYRTSAEYISLFKDIGFQMLKHENMFPEDCVLNKYPETRLRIYRFEKNV